MSPKRARASANRSSTDRPFVERLTQFWANHFAVSADKSVVPALAGSYEREAIRPYVLGNFNDMLLATERHPAMLLYLDNQLSMGPDSRAARNIARRNPDRKTGSTRTSRGRRWSCTRSGVDGGYTQTDVTAFSEVLTGWSIAGPDGWRTGAQPGTFLFRAAMHEPGSKVVMGKRYPDTEYDQCVAVLHDLAARPATAHFIATKLARHFIADDPPESAVQRVARAFSQSGGDLPAVYKALIDSPEAWRQPVAKYKSPSDYIVSAFRGLELPVKVEKPPVGLFQQLGQRIGRRGPRGMARSQRGLGWRLGAAEADRVGRCGRTKSGSAPQRDGAGAAAAGQRAELARPVRRLRVPRASTGDRLDVGCAGVHEEMSQMKRRAFLTAGTWPRVGALLSARVTFAGTANGRKPRLVFVVLRGALDGLASVPACGDPGYASLRGDLALGKPGTDGGALPLDGFFGLHPSLSFMQQSYAARELIVFHAVASPYRDRSHFDGQNVLETGYPQPHAVATGWLNRALAAMPAGWAPEKERGISIAPTAPLVMRGPAAVTSWSPSHLAPLDDDTLQRISDLYSHDPQLAQKLAEALAAEAIVDEKAGGMANAMDGGDAGSGATDGDSMMAGDAAPDHGGNRRLLLAKRGKPGRSTRRSSRRPRDSWARRMARRWPSSIRRVGHPFQRGRRQRTACGAAGGARCGAGRPESRLGPGVERHRGAAGDGVWPHGGRERHARNGSRDGDGGLPPRGAVKGGRGVADWPGFGTRSCIRTATSGRRSTCAPSMKGAVGGPAGVPERGARELGFPGERPGPAAHRAGAGVASLAARSGRDPTRRRHSARA